MSSLQNESLLAQYTDYKREVEEHFKTIQTQKMLVSALDTSIKSLEQRNGIPAIDFLEHVRNDLEQVRDSLATNTVQLLDQVNTFFRQSIDMTSTSLTQQKKT